MVVVEVTVSSIVVSEATRTSVVVVSVNRHEVVCLASNAAVGSGAGVRFALVSDGITVIIQLRSSSIVVPRPFVYVVVLHLNA